MAFVSQLDLLREQSRQVNTTRYHASPDNTFLKRHGPEVYIATARAIDAVLSGRRYINASQITNEVNRKLSRTYSKNEINAILYANSRVFFHTDVDSSGKQCAPVWNSAMDFSANEDLLLPGDEGYGDEDNYTEHSVRSYQRTHSGEQSVPFHLVDSRHAITDKVLTTHHNYKLSKSYNTRCLSAQEDPAYGSTVIVVGSRSLSSRAAVFEVLLRIRPSTIICGVAKGVDTTACAYAQWMGINLITYSIRAGETYLSKDRRMLNDYPTAPILAFWDGASKGTKATIDYCRSRVTIYTTSPCKDRTQISGSACEMFSASFGVTKVRAYDILMANSYSTLPTTIGDFVGGISVKQFISFFAASNNPLLHASVDASYNATNAANVILSSFNATIHSGMIHLMERIDFSGDQPRL